MQKIMAQGQHWLNRWRIRIYSCIVFTLFFILAIGFIRYSNFVEKNSYTFISDFTVFWSASQLALEGQAATAYQSQKLDEVIKSVAPDEGGKPPNGWFYPPTFLLVILPFGLLPYLPAYVAFMLLTLAGYVAVVYRIIRDRDVFCCLAGFSGVWINLFFSQNGFLTAAVAGAALLNLEKRPVLAGIFIGSLSIKPHLALLFPVVLIAIAAWRTLLTAAVVALVFLLTSTALFGVNTFTSWLHSLELAKNLMETAGGPGFWANSPTVFAFLRLLGATVIWSYVGQTVVAFVAIAALWRVWRCSDSRPLRGAAFTTATLLISPYMQVYDLAWLALSIAWTVKLGMERGWLRGEREILVVAWFLPLLSIWVAKISPFQIGPLILLILLWSTLRRTA